jgi:NAD(P)-dependent dehydrogenase (short-subunit alcohol dehydrogenase family)
MSTSQRTPGKRPVILVTGATDGIGKEAALELARRGARVLVHGRRPDRLAETAAAIRAAGGEALEPLLGDLSALDGVRAMAADLVRRGVSVEVLLNNAGIYAREREVSADGFEMTMAVNHFAPFLLTHLLLASSAGAALARIVNVSSVAHTRGNIDLADLRGTAAPFDHYSAYAASKLANVLFTVELARRLAPRKITVNALHPGVVSTKLLTEGFQMQGADTVQTAAATSVRLALDPEVEGITGRYFANKKEANMSPLARDAELARRFYEESAALVGVAPIV